VLAEEPAPAEEPRPVEEAPPVEEPAPVEEAPREASASAPRRQETASASREPSEPRSTSAARASRPAPPTPVTADATDATALLESNDSASTAELDQYASAASSGRLGSSEIMALEMVEASDPAYTRSRTLLLTNSQRKGDAAGVKRYLDQLFRLPENNYNPLFLIELARYQVNRRAYGDALAAAQKAEQHWARLPSELVFEKKAEIYEIQAAATQGRFYKAYDDANADDAARKSLLDDAIRGWQRYRGHVTTRSRTDLVSRADKEIEKLEDIRARID
jgi:hypothetical protein